MHQVLSVNNLTVRFASDQGTVNAVNGISIAVQQGKAVALVGESGSGKSTAVKAMLRLLPTNAEIRGDVVFQGKNLANLSSKEIRKIRGRNISMIFQNPKMFLNPTKTIGQQIIEPILYHHLATPSKAKEKAISLLDQVGIPYPEERYSNYPFEFSGGMLQRVMIAMALITEPELLIADEPTTSLDVTVQAEILTLLKRLQRDHGMSMVFVTHDLAVAAQVCDEVYVLYGGLVMEHITSEKLRQRSSHPYLQGLLRSIPRIDGPRTKLPFIPGQPPSTIDSTITGCIFANRCTRKMDRCEEQPELESVADRHEVACWLSTLEVSSYGG
ncbi:ABC transporter ATP-binding protein [Alicyclobacillus sp. SO9]|uniref:ABC transporter ATP-binding protein n=1 Tax=Alicyclobacillus sp. SO9 TaxID=2665646 RepID=UPI0018E7EC66|nr:ABC transporter ATP-binding protein [Alicyclobacillus sp. SO9]QQE80548.1 ABC transporter ATP-binding protein [Alicyclobacillus sp. SO9]